MEITGVQHIKIFVGNLARSREWYEKVFRLGFGGNFVDGDGEIRGMIFTVPGADLQIALRESPKLAAALCGADPFVLNATRAGLDAWDGHLDGLGIPHTSVFRVSGGHALGFRDPDGLQISLYAADG